MFSAKLIAIVALAMAQEAVAFNAHRHHQALHAKRDMAVVEDVAVVTDWTTVTVYADGSLVSSTSTSKFIKDVNTESSSSSTSTSASAGFTSSANITSPTSTSTSISSSSSSSSTSSPTPTTVSSTKISSSSSSSSSTTISTSSSSSAAAPAVSPNYVGGNTNWVLTPIYAPTTLSTAVKASSVAAQVAEVLTQTPSSTSSSAAATATASSSSSGSGKRGLAYNSGNLLSPFLGSGSKCSWSYNWGQTADSSAPSDVEFVPMLWAPKDASEWSSNANAAISNGATALLGYNECDNAGQCNMDAASAAASFKTDMAEFAGKAKIGAPAITNSGNAGEGIDWLKSFVSACNGECNFDFCPLHWYSPPDADEFLSHITNVHEACGGKPVWITEFAPISGTPDEISSFLKKIMDAMDNDSTYSFVERYSYFMVSTDSMLSSETSLSTYGQTFAYY